MWGGRLLRTCWLTLALLATAGTSQQAHAQANFDRPGGDYLSLALPSGDPAACALICERDRRCRAWSFSYPREGDGTEGAACWLKSTVPQRVEAPNIVSGVRGAGVVERHNNSVETSIDRY